MDPLEDEDLREDESQMESDLTSADSSVSSFFDSRSTTTSSTDASGSSSGSSGEIPALVVEGAVVPRLLMSPTISTGGEGNGNIELEESMVTLTTERQRCVGRNNRGVTWGFTSFIGRRREMEDAVAVIPGFLSSSCDHIGGCTAPGSRNSGEITPVNFFGVFDGHGGSQVAKFCAERIHEIVAEEWGRLGSGDGWRRRWEEAFSSGFERADNEVVAESIAPEIVGSTAVVVAVTGCQIITSNCGDSRAVLCRRTQTIPLSVDHKPDREDELMRIEGEGGRVINWNGARVLGVLAMSRAIDISSADQLPKAVAELGISTFHYQQYLAS